MKNDYGVPIRCIIWGYMSVCLLLDWKARPTLHSNICIKIFIVEADTCFSGGVCSVRCTCIVYLMSDVKVITPKISLAKICTPFHKWYIVRSIEFIDWNPDELAVKVQFRRKEKCSTKSVQTATYEKRFHAICILNLKDVSFSVLVVQRK